MEIITKLIIAGIILFMFIVCAFLGWRVIVLIERVKQVQKDRNELEEERRKQSNKLRLKGVEMDEENKKKIVLSEIDNCLILNALNMPDFREWVNDPKTPPHTKKAYRNLKEKIKESID